MRAFKKLIYKDSFTPGDVCFSFSNSRFVLDYFCLQMSKLTPETPTVQSYRSYCTFIYFKDELTQILTGALLYRISFWDPKLVAYVKHPLTHTFEVGIVDAIENLGTFWQ